MDREQYNSELINAANQGDVSLVAHYLRAVNKNALNRALIEAARNGHENCVEILIPVTDRMSRAGALENAVVQNNVGCVQMLIPVCTPSAFENRALTLAAMNGNVECVQLLLPHCNLSHMHTPLIAAATRDYVECVKLILPYALPLTNGAKVFVETLLENNIECLQLLLPHCNLQECHVHLAKNHPGSENEQRMQNVIAQWQRDTLTTALTDCPSPQLASTRKM